MHNANRDIWVVIPAAGSGRRLGSITPKQFLPLAGKIVIEHSLDLFSKLDVVAGMVIVGDLENDYLQQLSKRYANTHCVVGGAERMDSVKAGVEFVIANTTSAYVMVHDAARPCLHIDDCRALIEARDKHKQGLILAYKAIDSIKRVADHQVVSSVKREEIVHAVTPQCAPAKWLKTALDYCIEKGLKVTDEAQALEQIGCAIGVVEGRTDNLKITYLSDLAIAESILEQRQ